MSFVAAVMEAIHLQRRRLCTDKISLWFDIDVTIRATLMLLKGITRSL
jgi:hypothetical protein